MQWIVPKTKINKQIIFRNILCCGSYSGLSAVPNTLNLNSLMLTAINTIAAISADVKHSIVAVRWMLPYKQVSRKSQLSGLMETCFTLLISDVWPTVMWLIWCSDAFLSQQLPECTSWRAIRVRLHGRRSRQCGVTLWATCSRCWWDASPSTNRFVSSLEHYLSCFIRSYFVDVWLNARWIFSNLPEE